VSFAFLWNFADLVARWASWDEAESRDWPGGGAEVFRRALDGHAALPGTASRNPG
jgi:hypothetical protein